MSVSIWIPIVLIGTLLILAVCVGASMDTERQRRQGQRLAEERRLLRAEREWLTAERSRYNQALLEYRQLTTAGGARDYDDGPSGHTPTAAA